MSESKLEDQISTMISFPLSSTSSVTTAAGSSVIVNWGNRDHCSRFKLPWKLLVPLLVTMTIWLPIVVPYCV